MVDLARQPSLGSSIAQVRARRSVSQKRIGEVAAIFYSLFESAKLAGVDPNAYVAQVLRRARLDPKAITLPKDLIS